MKIFALTILFSFIIKLRFPKDKPTTTVYSEVKYKYYVMNYSINSFTGATEAPVNVVVVY